MKEHIAIKGMIMAAVVAGTAYSAEPNSKWTTATANGRIEASYEGKLVMAWQQQLQENPIGGQKFASSAFLHPLCTPSGFEWTAIQAPDHMHHFGLWWPWKYIEVDGAKYNSWEIQEGQGAHIAKNFKPLANTDGLAWTFENDTVIKKAGADPKTVIAETATVGLKMVGDSEILDISITQKATGSPVTIVNYRYSGFSWRGPLSWNKDNSTMTTSAGKNRDNANGTPASWVVVSGPTPKGTASVLMMSAAVESAGAPEKVRVWDSKNHDGMPFVNFNPVTDKSQPLDDAHPAVSNRKYRVIAADHTIDAAEAEAAWKKWMQK